MSIISKIDKINSFIRSHFPGIDSVPLHQPKFSGNEKKYLCDAIDSTFVSSVGAYVNKFEEMIAEFTHSARAVAVVNGTAGLQVALRLAGVKADDEVITQSLTFIATANAILYNGAHPIFLDVDLNTMGLSPVAVEEFLTEHAVLKDDGCYNKLTKKKIAACMPMHTFGFPVNLDGLLAVCTKWKIPIVEDAAESLGSFYHEKHTGNFGTLGVFSFNGNKIITSGGGGAIISNDISLAQMGKHLTTTAKVPHAYEFIHDEMGYNFRMPNVNAALACAQMEQLELFIESKRKLAGQYEIYFKEQGIKFRTELPGTRANYWLMCVELNDKSDRDAFLKSTNGNGVMTRPIWRLMTSLPMYSHYQKDSQKNASYLQDRIVNIPSNVE
jgi:perosamine synthetase